MTAVRHAWRYLRYHGWKATARAFAHRYIYSRQDWVIFRGTLGGPPVKDHLGAVHFRLAMPADLERLSEFERYGRGTIQRLAVEKDGDWLFVACHGDRIVATRRYSRTVPAHSRLSGTLKLEEHQVWGADVFCLPAYRNQGIARHLSTFAERFLANQNYTEMLSAVGASNTPSLRMNLHKGNRPLYRLSYVRRLLFERVHLADAAAEDIR